MASRYQQRTLYAERGPVKTFEGLDPLTGLPVLIYRFAGRPARALAQLESENLPGVLELGVEGGEAQVVVAYSHEYRPLVHPLHVSPTVLLLDSARALRDAAHSGVLHGDLRPVRFLASREHVLLEGFGIPWREDADFSEDIRAWGEAVRELAGDVLPGSVGALLERCTDPDPDARPDASTLYDALSEAIYARQGSESAPDERASVLSLDDLELPLEQPAWLGRAKQMDRAPHDVAPNDRVPEELDDFVLEGLALADLTSDDAAQGDRLDKTFGDDDVLLDNVALDNVALDNAALDDVVLDSVVLDSVVLDSVVVDSVGPDKLAPRPPAPPAEPEPDFLSAWRRSGRGQGSGEREDADPMIIISDPGLEPSTRTPDEDEPSYLKTLPPGATYRSGDSEDKIYVRPGSFEEYTFDDEAPDRARRRRRVVMLLLLFVAAGVLGALALWRQQQTQPSFTGTAGSYVVEVQVRPENLPPATLYVVSSPEGSRLTPGSAISTVPGQIVLDHTGSWRLQARLQGVASEEVTVLVPEQRSVAVEMPTGGP